MSTIYISEFGGFDAALKANRRPGTRFILGPGTYSTKGAWAFQEFDFCMLAPECSIEGDPNGGTLLELVEPVDSYTVGNILQEPRYYEVLTGGARKVGNSNSITVRNLTIETLNSNYWPVVGLHVWTNQATIQGICVLNCWGHKSFIGQCREGFGIIVNNPSVQTLNGNFGGHLITDCTVYASPKYEYSNDLYVTGIYLGCYTDPVATLMLSVVHNCRVVGRSNARVHCGYGFNCRVEFVDCVGYYCDSLFFTDTGFGEYVRIKYCTGFDLIRAFELMLGKEAFWRDIEVKDSTFCFRNVASHNWVQAVLLRAGLDAESPSERPIEDVRFLNCRFSSPNQTNSSQGRARGPMIQPVTFLNCTWVGNWSPPVYQNGAQPWII